MLEAKDLALRRNKFVITQENNLSDGPAEDSY